MKKFLVIGIYFTFSILNLSGQITAIFVNDNTVDEESSLKVFTLIEQYLGTCAYFNATEEDRSPNFSELEPFNLVIWYCGTDEDDLYFWNGNYQDNPELSEYLDQGGNLWLMGRGFLNARYIKPPRNFNKDTFIYNYLGVSRWSSESYTSDNGMGAPELLRAYATLVNTLTLEKIEWEDPPEPMVDGCELIEGCHEAYYFGPGGYTLYGQPTAFYFHTSRNKNMTFTFDPYRMNSNGNLSTLLSDVLRFYEDILSDVGETGELIKSLKVYPIPADQVLNVDFIPTGSTLLRLLSARGEVVSEKLIIDSKGKLMQTQFDVRGLSNGIYLLSIENSVGKMGRKIVVSKK